MSAVNLIYLFKEIHHPKSSISCSQNANQQTQPGQTSVEFLQIFFSAGKVQLDIYLVYKIFY